MANNPAWAAAARVVRRTGFGATGAEVDRALSLGTDAYVKQMMTAAASTDPGVVATPPPAFPVLDPPGKAASAVSRKEHSRQLGAQLHQLTTWWLARMVAVQQPSTEKLTFCWHNHFATSATKVRHAQWMLAQNLTLRALGRSDFASLASAMLTDAAMLQWLDGEKNTAAAPNENLSREFMELFALGAGDTYTETDVREGARALTGWRILADGSTHLVERRHDEGSKTFLGVTGNLGVTGYLDAILARPGAAPYLATRWWHQLGSDDAATPDTISRLTAAYGSKQDLTALFTALFGCPQFAAAQGSLVIGPVEWLVGAMRALKVPVTDSAKASTLTAALQALGQVPFYPPNVGGWPSGQAWLSTAAADTRLQTALNLAKTGNLLSVSGIAPSARMQAVSYLLGVSSWSDRTAAVLATELDNPQRLVAVALNSPEYLVH